MSESKRDQSAVFNNNNSQLSLSALGAVAHDLGHLLREARREVASIAAGKDPGTQSIARLERLLTIAQDECDGMIEGAAVFQLDSIKSAHCSQTDIAACINSELSTWASRAKGCAVELKQFGESATINCHAALIRRAIRNLIINGIHASAPNSELSLTIQAQTEPLGVIVTVKNTGRAPDPAIVKGLKERSLMCGNSKPLAAGPINSGLGLFVAATVATLHQGSLSVDHANGITSFVLSIRNIV